MRNIISIYTCLFCLLVAIMLCPEALYAQKSKQHLRHMKRQDRRISLYEGELHPDLFRKYSTAGISMNGFNYFGDIAPATFSAKYLNFTRPGVGVSYGMYLSPRFMVKGELLWGRLEADDFAFFDPYDKDEVFKYTRNLHFRNHILELGATAAFSIFPEKSNYIIRRMANPYLFAGAALLYHNPKAKVPPADLHGDPLPNAGTWVPLQPLGTEGQYSEGYNIQPYSKLQIALPLGAGVRFKLSRRLNASLEMGYRFLFFDYLDDVSGHYVDKGALNSELARAMSDRSMETIAVVSGEPRNMQAIQNVIRQITYVGKDGREYTAFMGYGHENEGKMSNKRGGEANDSYVVTTLRISYILGTTVHPFYKSGK